MTGHDAWSRSPGLLASLFATAWWCVSVVSFGQGTDDREAFFEKKVRPLLMESCYECHSGIHAKGGVSLDSREGWMRGGDSGVIIEAGMPDQSLLFQAVSDPDAASPMPPKKRLAAEQIEVLRRWIADGAFDPREATGKLGGMSIEEAARWWSFQPIHPTPPPEIESDGNPIDRFLDVALQKANLQAAPLADRRTLMRRIRFDLTGLPPTPQEVEAFIADESPDAWEKVVDRLLASPEYAERWGRHWLDVVRYADTAGENTDRPLPEMWRYRNWVFRAIGEDRPYDQFVAMQLAGDLLRRDASGDDFSEGIIATGYLALARRFGHDIDNEKHLMYEDVIDNLGKAFLGLTVSCARCHDHKYDPLTSADYYALYGILDSSRFSFSGCEAKGAPRDLVPLLRPEEADAMRSPWREARAQWDTQIASLDQRQQESLAVWKDSRAKARSIATGIVPEAGSWQIQDPQGQPVAPIAVRQGQVLLLEIGQRSNHGADTTQVEWRIVEVGGQQRRWSAGDLAIAGIDENPKRIGDGQTTAWAFIDLREATLGFLPQHLPKFPEHEALEGWKRGDTPSVFVNRSEQEVAVWTKLPARGLFLHPAQDGPVGLAWVSPIDGVVSIEGVVSDAHPAPGLDGVDCRIDLLEGVQVVESLVAGRNHQQEKESAVAQRDRQTGPEPMVPVAFSVVDAQIRSARVHQQGDPEKLGDEVPRRWIEVFGGHRLDRQEESGRRELAEWIVRHPLASRVVVNRLWQHHFGQGIVRSVNDFGSRGQQPSHPELLEWLVDSFQRCGYHWKPLHRLILLSHAYQRSSDAPQGLVAADPENRWFGRFQRSRLDAEQIRDSLLVVAGNLDRAPGQQHPFPPAGSWTFTQHTPFAAVYDNSKRTAYQMVQRQRRHPFLALFDGADPNASTGERQRTTVPTQALFFLNDPFFHQQATILAQSLQPIENLDQRWKLLMQIVLQRDPRPEETQLMYRFVQSHGQDQQAAWHAWVRVVLAGNEFLHVE